MICVNSVSVSPKSITLKVGTWSYAAHAETLPSDADCKCVVWSSDNTSVATVNSSNGYIYAKAAGTAVISATATDGSGCTDSIVVTVNDTVSVESVTMNRTAVSLSEGDQTALTAIVCPQNADNRAVIWSSSNACVATVSGGVVTAVAKGTATIWATAADRSGKGAACTVTVTKDILVTSITVDPCCETMPKEKSAYFYATVCPETATNANVVWSSSNPCVATVNPHSGLVYTRNAGTTVISATACDGSGVKGSCNLTVTDCVCVEEITINESLVKLNKGDKYQLAATVLPEDATNKSIMWRSSNPCVASVGVRTGLVTARGAGRAFIHAVSRDGSCVEGVCRISVKQTVRQSAEETPVNTVKESTFADPVDVYTGAHLLQNTVMSLFGGQGISLVAHYDSTHLAEGTLGSGWSHNYEKHIVLNGCEAYVYNNPSIYSKYEATSECCTSFKCASPQKQGYLLTVDATRQYPYIISCNSMRTEYYNADGDLAKIVDHQGFETWIRYSDTQVIITDGVSGKKIYLEKNSDCRICAVYDDAGRRAEFTYDGNLLISIRDVNGNTLSYEYDEDGRVKSGTDSKGICYFENTYDEYGRVIEQKDAIVGSRKSTFVYEDDKRITTDRNGKQSTREYDCNGLLIRHTDENGNTKTYEYDDRCNVIRENDANGNSTIKVYNSFNKPTEITDKNGNKTCFTYDFAGDVVRIRYPEVDGVVPEEIFVYNGYHRVVRHTDIRGTVTTYTYDANGMPATKKVGDKNAVAYSYQGGLLKSTTDAMGNTTTFAHNAIGQVTSKTDADGKVTTYEYDAAGNLLKTIDANGKTVETVYDGNYQKTSVTDANGNKTTYSYNGNMKNDMVTLPDNHTIHYEYDGEDRVVKVIDQVNNVTNIAYDDGGRVISKKLPDGATVHYEYDNVGNLVKETNPKGAVVTKTYDKMGNVLTVTDDEGNFISYEYNAMSKVTKVSDAIASTTVYLYSKAGDLLSETDAQGHTKTYTYDAYGNRLTATDAKGNVTTCTYDQNNNLLTVTDALGHTTTYTYDCLNRCVSVKDALGNVIRYGYDALGRRTTVTDARGNVFTTVYDGNGNVVKTIDAKNNTVSETVYNSLNQPLTVTDAMGKTTTYTYNEIGKVKSVTDAMSHRTEMAYNTRGQNTSVRDVAGCTSTATYDLLGNVTKLAGPLGGATHYTYDDMGRLRTESTVSGGTVQYAYNELNMLWKRTNARGQNRQFYYDTMGRIRGYISPESMASYTYDENGNQLTVTDKQGTVTRTYDALNRVTSYTDTYGNTIRYEYDAVGNLTKLIYPDNTAVTYAYDENHNLIRVIDWANRVTTYTYDANNRVVGVTKPDGSTVATVYDSMQRESPPPWRRPSTARILRDLSIRTIICRELSRKKYLQILPKCVILMMTSVE